MTPTDPPLDPPIDTSTAPTIEAPPLILRIVRFPLTRLVLSLVVMAAVIVPAMLAFLPHMGAKGLVSAWTMLPAELIQALGAVAGMLVVGLLVERASFAQLGFGRRAVVQTASGFGAGAALLTFVVGVLAVSGWYHLVPAAPGTTATGREFGGEILLFLLVAIFEEIFFRGIMFRILEQLLGTWIALALTAAQFGWMHHGNPGATWASTVGIAVEAGVLLAATFVVTRNLWAALGMHWAWNLFEGPVFGTPVSGVDLRPLLHAKVTGPVLWTGGAFGPEAGVICMLAGGTLGILLMVIAFRRGNVFTPRWMRRLFRMEIEGAPVAPLPPAVG